MSHARPTTRRSQHGRSTSLSPLPLSSPFPILSSPLLFSMARSRAFSRDGATRGCLRSVMTSSRSLFPSSSREDRERIARGSRNRNRRTAKRKPSDFLPHCRPRCASTFRSFVFLLPRPFVVHHPRAFPPISMSPPPGEPNSNVLEQLAWAPRRNRANFRRSLRFVGGLFYFAGAVKGKVATVSTADERSPSRSCVLLSATS